MNPRLLLILNALASLAVPFVLERITPLSVFESWEVAGFLFIALCCIEILDLTKAQLEIRRSEQRAWSEQDDFDGLLRSIQTDYRNMGVPSPNEDASLLRLLVRQRVDKLRDDVHVAAESKELYVDDNHAVDTRRVTDLFRLGKANEYWEVYKIEGDGSIFGVYGGSYFKQVYKLATSGHIAVVRALIVVDPNDTAACAKAGQLVRFYDATPKYATCTISRADFEKIHQDSGLEQFEDFGVFGDVLLFRTLSYEPSNRGKYCYDSLKIKKHKEFFEACWGLPNTLHFSAENALKLEDVLKL